jgi:hypothetical protein
MILEAVRYDGLTSGGQSDVAQFIAAKAREGRQAIYETHTFGHAFYEAIEALMSIKEHASQPNWDGYGAEPVRRETIWFACRFLEALSPGLPTPVVGAEPDGDITLEWYKSPRRTVSVSVTGAGDLHYAALVGPNKQYGTEAFFGDVPQPIVDLVRRIQD